MWLISCFDYAAARKRGRTRAASVLFLGVFRLICEFLLNQITVMFSNSSMYMQLLGELAAAAAKDAFGQQHMCIIIYIYTMVYIYIYIPRSNKTRLCATLQSRIHVRPRHSSAPPPPHLTIPLLPSPSPSSPQNHLRSRGRWQLQADRITHVAPPIPHPTQPHQPHHQHPFHSHPPHLIPPSSLPSTTPAFSPPTRAAELLCTGVQTNATRTQASF